MGAGKTTVGRLLARRLRWSFVDLDRRIERRTGRTIAAIFRDDGEAAFREIERAAAVEVGAETDVVVAAGGGAFTVEQTRAALRKDAFTVWLRCALPTLLDRVDLGGSRPLARSRETIGPLLAAREPAYSLADLTVDTTSGPPDKAALLIAAAVERLREADRTHVE
jgi:shikimate kinase